MNAMKYFRAFGKGFFRKRADDLTQEDAEEFYRDVKEKTAQRNELLNLIYEPSKVVPIKMLEESLLCRPNILEAIQDRTNISGLTNLLTVLTTNSTFDRISEPFFEKLFVDILLTDRFFSYCDHESFDKSYNTVYLYRLFRYNLIFKQNLIAYAEKQVKKSFI